MLQVLAQMPPLPGSPLGFSAPFLGSLYTRYYFTKLCICIFLFIYLPVKVLAGVGNDILLRLFYL